MPFCGECGKKISEDAKFCKKCGTKVKEDEIETKAEEREKKEEPKVVERVVERGYHHEIPRKKSMAWLWIILIIILIFTVIASIQQGGVSVSSGTENRFLSSTHEETKCGIFGCKTESKDCPFWNRDC